MGDTWGQYVTLSSLSSLGRGQIFSLVSHKGPDDQVLVSADNATRGQDSDAFQEDSLSKKLKSDVFRIEPTVLAVGMPFTPFKFIDVLKSLTPHTLQEDRSYVFERDLVFLQNLFDA